MIHLSVQKAINAGAVQVSLDLKLEVNEGAFVSIIGKSGAGKTTFLKMLAGLISPDKGSIQVNNQVWFSDKEKAALATQKRDIGYVFQDYALFPNMTVEQNLLFGAKDKKEEDWLDYMLEILQLSTYRFHLPHALSGGQQQRVALGRALMRKPSLLLLDEPFASVDETTKKELMVKVKELQKKYKITIIMVSHNEAECKQLSDQIYELREGCFRKREVSEVAVADVVACEDVGDECYVEMYLEGKYIKVRLSKGKLLSHLFPLSQSA